MYHVFHMGHRIEVFTTEESAADIMAVAEEFEIEAKIVGRVEHANTSELILRGSFGEIKY